MKYFLLLFFICSCATSPTGRTQLLIFSEDQMSEMGEKSFADVKTQKSIEKDSKINSYVKCITTPLVLQIDDHPEAWEIVVFKDETANAFALPGKKIGVHTGILKVAKTKAQLAAVIGHEIAHVTAQHGNERVSEAFAAEGTLSALSALSKDSPQKKLVMGALGLGTSFGVLLPHGRRQESEADIVGQRYMAQAGFDPRESVDLWKNMQSESGGGGPPEFMSTHPSHDTRISDLNTNLAETVPIYEQTSSRPNCKL